MQIFLKNNTETIKVKNFEKHKIKVKSQIHTKYSNTIKEQKKEKF